MALMVVTQDEDGTVTVGDAAFIFLQIAQLFAFTPGFANFPLTRADGEHVTPDMLVGKNVDEDKDWAGFDFDIGGNLFRLTVDPLGPTTEFQARELGEASVDAEPVGVHSGDK